MATPVLEKTTLPERYRFTVEQYDQMVAAGILTENDRVELIDGEIIEMAAIGPTHAMALDRLTRIAVQQTSVDIRVSVQNPINHGPRSEPQPDLCLSHYRSGLIAPPTPEDIFFVVEVSDTTIEYDRDTKLSLYAAAGTLETWILDVKAALLERYTEPRDGSYQRVERVGRGQMLASTTLPAIMLAVDDLLR